MKIYQALKEKNKIVGKINELTMLIQQKNSMPKTNPNHFDLDSVLSELHSEKAKLIQLKTAIYKANFPIQEKIFTLSELKSSVKFWTGLNTKEGLEVGHFNRESVEYKAHFNEVQTRLKIEEIQAEIEKIQEELDYFNHTTDISI